MPVDHVPGGPPDFAGVDRLRNLARNRHAAADDRFGIVGDAFAVEALEGRHQQEPDPATPVLDHGIGGQGGGDRYQVDGGQQLWIESCQGVGDAGRKIEGGR